MLHLWLGDVKRDNVVKAIDPFFDSGYEDEWLLDPMVKEMIRDIDKSEVIGVHLIDSPVLGPIPPSELSGGVKALICMLCDDSDYIQDATNCGDNCAVWIQRISQKKELTVRLGYIMRFSDEEYFDIVIMNNGAHVDNYHDFVRVCIEAGL